MHRREDQYRSALEQSRSGHGAARRRRMYRRRRWSVALTVLAAALLAFQVLSGVSLASLIPGGDEVAQRPAPSDPAAGDARGSTPDGNPDGAGPDPERSVLAAHHSASERRAPEGTGPEVDPTAGGADEAEAQKARTASREPLNVLILGVDRRPSEATSAGRSDTMMLAQVTPGTGRVELLSVPRDLFVDVGSGVEDRINTAYAYGGVEQAKTAMENVTGVSIDAHAIIDFRGFEDVIDAMGGVQVDVEDEIPPKYKIEDGPQTLDGKQALFYARYRKTAGGDLDRIAHQQKMLAALRAKILSWNTVTKLPAMLRIVNENVDTDLGLLEAISLGRALAGRGDRGDLEAVQLRGYPTTLDSGAQVLVPDHEANEEILRRFRD